MSSLPAMHYGAHVAVGAILGAMLVLGAWATSLAGWALKMKDDEEARFHTRVRNYALAIALLAVLFLTSWPASAQVDTTARTWLQQPYDGRLWHDLPPPANVVTAGLLLEHDARMQRSAVWGIVAGSAAGTLLYLQNRDAGLGVIGASIGLGLYFDLRGIESRRRAGALLQSGYRITNRYEILPDSVAPGPHLRIVPIR